MLRGEGKAPAEPRAGSSEQKTILRRPNFSPPPAHRAAEAFPIVAASSSPVHGAFAQRIRNKKGSDAARIPRRHPLIDLRKPSRSLPPHRAPFTGLSRSVL